MLVYSFDLKSSTDRWPLQIVQEITCYLFDDGFASAAVSTALASTMFEVPFTGARKAPWMSFVAGQPLGYYSSWYLFALSLKGTRRRKERQAQIDDY